MQRHPAGTFLLGAFLWSWGIWLALVWTDLPAQTRGWDVSYILGLSGPMVAALAVTWIAGGRAALWPFVVRSLALPAWRWLTVALVLPACLVVGALLVSQWWLGTRVPLPRPALHLLAPYFLLMMVRSGPLNEEFGWRGFLLPHLLKRYNPLVASLLLAPAWAVWHAPLWFLPLLPHKYWPFGWFVLLVLPTTFLFTWLYLRAQGRLWVVIVFHTSINATLLYLPILPPRHSTLVPFGAWIAVTWAVAGFLLVRHRKEFARPACWQALTPHWAAWPRLRSPGVAVAPVRSCRGTEPGDPKPLSLEEGPGCVP